MRPLNYLQSWASLLISERKSYASWPAVLKMIEAAKQLLAEDMLRLQQQLDISDQVLAPLEDPFHSDFGLHRWLGGAREESYSDWLEYSIRQLEAPGLVYGLFGLCPPEGAQGKPDVQREAAVEEGHPGRSGRIDLIVLYRGVRPLVIEIKIAGADEADTAKQEGYAISTGDSDRVLQ